jgi:ribonucleoside-triphosphate reductase
MNLIKKGWWIKMVQTKCEVYSRVVGYIRPVSNWNDSKQAEFHDRKKFDAVVNKILLEIPNEKHTKEIIDDLEKQSKL